MKIIIILLLFLSGCVSSVPENINIVNIPHLSADDWTMWLPMVKRAPYYPESLVKQKIEGCVKVQFVVNSQGEPQQAVVVKSIPEGIFNKYSLVALKSFHYSPSKSNQVRKPILTYNIFSFSLPSQNMARKRAYWEHECQ